jgi:hypothetical protein
MPFTLSHPAAAIPFLRTRLDPSALVIGCMAPDFEYFLHFAPEGGFGHTLAGVFAFDLPAAFIVLWLFHVYAKDPLYTWLPASVRRRIRLGPAALQVRNIAQFALVLLSILIGVATHILWDSFTHPDFWPYQHWQFLHRTVQLPVYGSMEYLRVIQHGSTVLGAAVLLLWFWSWFRRTVPMQPETATYPRENHRVALLVICIAALIAAVLRGLDLPEFGFPEDNPGRKELLARAVITAIDFFWLGVLVYGAFRARARNKLQDAQAPRVRGETSRRSGH